jgi:hypothetical protein
LVGEKEPLSAMAASRLCAAPRPQRPGAAVAKLMSGVHRDYETDAGKNLPIV